METVHDCKSCRGKDTCLNVHCSLIFMLSWTPNASRYLPVFSHHLDAIARSIPIKVWGVQVEAERVHSAVCHNMKHFQTCRYLVMLDKELQSHLICIPANRNWQRSKTWGVSSRDGSVVLFLPHPPNQYSLSGLPKPALYSSYVRLKSSCLVCLSRFRNTVHPPPSVSMSHHTLTGLLHMHLTGSSTVTRVNITIKCRIALCASAKY